MCVCVVLTTSCKKEELSTIEQQTFIPSISLGDNYIVFNTIEDYEETVGNISETGEIPELLTNISNSLKSGEVEDLDIEDEFLASILNSDGIVQIGEWLFKVNLQNKTVLALNSSNIELYNELCSNTENDLIYSYSTDDDVLDLIADGEYGASTKKSANWCRKPSAGSHTDQTWPGHAYIGIEFKIHYTKAGIYYALYSKIKEGGNIYPDARSVTTLDLKYYIKGRCRDSNKGHITPTIVFHTDSREDYKFYMYQRTRSAEKYAIRQSGSMVFGDEGYEINFTVETMTIYSNMNLTDLDEKVDY